MLPVTKKIMMIQKVFNLTNIQKQKKKKKKLNHNKCRFHKKKIIRVMINNFSNFRNQSNKMKMKNMKTLNNQHNKNKSQFHKQKLQTTNQKN